MFRFIRNIIIHFPLFDQWDEVWISKALVNWHKEGLTIDKFLKKYVGKERMGFAYKYSDEDESFPTMVSINFPPKYDDKSKLYLKDFITEKEGVEFSLIVMKSGIIEGQDFVFNVISKIVRKNEEDIK